MTLKYSEQGQPYEDPMEENKKLSEYSALFLEVEQNYSLALKFAEINWQYAQASSDEELLERARQANDESTNA